MRHMLKQLFHVVILFLLSLAAHAQQDILVYSGPGAGPRSVANTVALLQSVVADKFNIKTVGPEVLINQKWLSNTALLVIPGGADRPYLEKLAGQGNANIRQYVKSGGKFLGICAGAYYSADRIEFAKGDVELEVTGERELKFFPGLVAGPTYAGFDHRDLSLYRGTRAAKIYWQLNHPFVQEQGIYVYYNGGGSFIEPEKYSNTVVLARYQPEVGDTLPAAIIECQVGKGLAILSGPHFEWDPENLDTTAEQLRNIKPILVANNTDRLFLARHLLARLGIS